MKLVFVSKSAGTSKGDFFLQGLFIRCSNLHKLIVNLHYNIQQYKAILQLKYGKQRWDYITTWQNSICSRV